MLAFQEIAVALMVAAAVLFLVRRVVGRRSARRKPAQTFVPLASLKKRDRSRQDTGCH